MASGFLLQAEGLNMPSSIYFSDEQKSQVVEAAIKCGFRVSRGRGSQLALFVVMAANTASSGLLVSPPEKVDPKSKKASVKVAGSPSRR